MNLRIPFNRVSWITSTFLIGTFLMSISIVPYHIWHNGVDAFQICLFLFYYFATGFSITLGYHRLFSHLAFKAKWPVKLFTLLFGAAAFENAALDWVSDHRRHHKHVDEEDDPYDISKGFFHAHIGWLLFKLKPKPPMDNVADLRKDKLIMWQYKWCHYIGVFVGFILPYILGYFYGGHQAALSAFLLSGILRVVVVQQGTFCINSLCHYMGRQPYSASCSARDSGIMALVTFGEGYHNYHHEFQHDYRNGVKAWQFDPTKWIIWVLSKFGLTSGLRRVADEKILLAEINETRRKIDASLIEYANKDSSAYQEIINKSIEQLKLLKQKFDENYSQLEAAINEKINVSKETTMQWKHDVNNAMDHLTVLKNSGFTLQPIT